MQAYGTALSRTSTETAPWYVIPANRKWYRNLVIGSVVAHTLAGLGMRYPEPPAGLDKIVVE